MKKLIKIFSVLLISLLFTSYAFAATSVQKSSATMALVKDEVCDITFGKYGSFEKKMVNINTENKTIDISLTVKNNNEQNQVSDIAGEVVLLIDSSNSMSTNPVTVDGVTTTRKQLVISAANLLVDKLYSANPDIKMGVVEFATSTEVSEEGSEKDAKIITPSLVDNLTDVKQALATVSEDVMGPRTNIQIGLRKANELLQTSTDNSLKKYIVVLTDAIPNTSDGVSLDTYTDATAIPTKNELLSIKESGVNVVSMLINMTDDPIQISQESPKPTYKGVAQKIFGTEVNPTAGSVYYVEDSTVTSTVTEKIYRDLVPVDNSNKYELTDIVINDYFPQNIVDNFDFEFLTYPDIGTAVQSGDTLTWTIPELKAGETSTFTYRLSLKDSFNSEIVGLNLPTNKDVTIDYKEDGVQGEQKHNDKCPVVILDVLATKDIPKTGSYTWLMVAGVATLGVIASGYGIVKSIRINK